MWIDYISDSIIKSILFINMNYYLAILTVTSKEIDPSKIDADITKLVENDTTVDLRIKVINGIIKAKLLKWFLLTKHSFEFIRKKTNIIKYGIVIYDEPTAKSKFGI